MSKYFFQDSDGNWSSDPVDEETLRRLVAEGVIVADSLIRASGWTKAHHAKRFPELGFEVAPPTGFGATTPAPTPGFGSPDTQQSPAFRERRDAHFDSRYESASIAVDLLGVALWIVGVVLSVVCFVCFANGAGEAVVAILLAILAVGVNLVLLSVVRGVVRLLRAIEYNTRSDAGRMPGDSQDSP